MSICWLPLIGPSYAPKLRFDVFDATSHWERRRAARLPWALYRGDWRWTPPLVREWPRAVDPIHNPMLAHATHALLLAEAHNLSLADGIVARLAIWAEPETRVGCFGMFEIINQPDLVEALFDAAETWFFENVPGLTAVRGPIDLDLLRPPGLLVDGFAVRSGAFLPYNPPYYPDLVASAGYEPAQAWQVYACDLRSRAYTAAQCASAGAVRVVAMSEWPSLTGAVADLYSGAGSGRAGAVSFETPAWPRASFVSALMGDRGAWLGLEGRLALRWLRQRMLVGVAEVAGQPLGAIVGVPDISVALRRANGRLLPLGWLPYVLFVNWTRRLRVFPAAVLSAHQGKNMALALYRALIDEAARRGFTTAIVGPLRLDEQPSAQAMTALGARPVQTYQGYQKTY